MSTSRVRQTRSIRIFVSHVSEDNDRLQPLLNALDAWDVDYWYDGVMHAGDPITPEIHAEISTRDYFIRVVSLSMRRKPTWVKIETDIFLGLREQERTLGRLGGRRLINLVLDAGCGTDAIYGQFSPIKAYELTPNEWMKKLREALPIELTAESNANTLRRELEPIRDPNLLAKTGLNAALDPPTYKAPKSTKILHRVEERHASLLVIQSPGASKFALSEDTTVIQRMDLSAISLRDEAVSRVQATITRTPDGEYEIRDGDGITGSTNHTLVEGKLVTLKPTRLHDGDLIFVGETVLRFQK